MASLQSERGGRWRTMLELCTWMAGQKKSDALVPDSSHNEI